MIRLSDRITRLPGYPLADVPVVKRRLIAAGVDVIDLGAGDNDAPAPAPVIERMQRAVATPALGKYGFQQGSPAFRKAATDWVERRFGQRFDPSSELLPLLGSKEGLAHLPFAVTNPGDVVVVPEPGYQAYLGGTLLSGAEPFVYPLRAERGFLVELDRLPAATLERTRLVFLNYPNNPTAAVAGLEYLEKTVSICRAHGIVLAYDNPYCELTFDGYRAPSIFEVPGARDVALEFFSLSKSYSMTGWRLGFVVGNRELVGALTKIKTYVDTGPFLAAQDAGVEALERSERYVAAIRADLLARRDAGVAALARVGLPIEPPKAAMYLWVPLPEGIESAGFARHLLEQHGVVVLPGSGFGRAGEGYFRIALTVSPSRIEQAVERIGHALATFDRRAAATTA
jgi:LL-diaminopimelate aminotransferase